ncbi:XRE family transcriptional regulator [Virgisporangium aurantiacum]|uniref:XRE family transcriptional regulator n=1 Tax=Virgisporangium aurantiacum TaxID=175570 RepID=A0A8J3Z2D5_9ACTN|nr:XRE family transcriptional regulator [Virgisporangium aurantiacum]
MGALRVINDGVELTLPSAYKQRLTLAVLLAHAGRWVPTDTLISAVWSGAEPPSARRNLHQYIHRLRGTLGPHRLPGRAGGYCVVVGDGLDSARFESTVVAGRAALAESGADPAVAARTLRSAVDLWRGPAYADFPDCDLVSREAERLDRLRLDAVESWAAATLALGQANDVVTELTDLTRSYQFRESLREQLMLALHRCGRRAEALDEFHQLRDLLRDHLGIEPGTTVQRLYLRILRGEEADTRTGTEAGADTGSVARDSRSGETAAPRPAARSRGAPPTVDAPALLPADVADFTGRAEHLAALDALVRGIPDALRIVTLDGAAGVGKSALAVHWSHRVRRTFPDGHLFLDLRGYSQEAPLRPIEALVRLFFALGVPPDRVPDNLDDATGMYRTLLADRKMLVVLDNARDAEQVRPLLPGVGESFTLVTSRDPLTALVARDGARRVRLEPLPAAEARALLASVLGAGRIRRDAATADLVEVCARLPLTLRIAGVYLLGEPSLSIASYVERLRADPLTGLDIPDAPQFGARAAFEFTYRILPIEVRRLYGLLGGVPGPHISDAAAAALAGVPVDQAGQQLRRLLRAHLLHEHAPGRFGMHDLLAAFARDVAVRDLSPSTRQQAVHRLLEWYLNLARAAGERLYPDVLRLPAAAPARAFTDDTDALAWLRGDEPNLIAAIHHAAGHGELPAAWQLADAMRAYLSQRGASLILREVGRTALAAAGAAGDAAGQIASYLGLAHEAMMSSRLADARDHYERALKLSETAGWTEAQAALLSNLGVLHARQGELDDALDRQRRALILHRRLDKPAGVAVNLGNLGGVYDRLGRLREAADAMTEALEIHRAGKVLSGQAMQLNNLAVIYRELGHLPEAITYGREALAVYRELGSAVGEGMALCDLAETFRAAGDPARALDHAERALAIPELADHPEHQAQSWHHLGLVHAAMARHDTAMSDYDRALATARTTGNPELEAQILVSLATAHTGRGHHDRAALLAGTALAIADTMRLGVLRGEARSARASVHLALGELGEAIALATEAYAIHDATGHRQGLIRALQLLADAYTARGDETSAGRYHTLLGQARQSSPAGVKA